MVALLRRPVVDGSPPGVRAATPTASPHTPNQFGYQALSGYEAPSGPLTQAEYAEPVDYAGWQATSTAPEVLSRPRRPRKKIILICAIVAVVVAGLLTGGYFVFLRSSAVADLPGPQDRRRRAAC